MTCNLAEIREQLDDLQKRLDLYEKRDMDSTQREHQELFDRIEKKRIARDKCRNKRDEVEK